MIGDNDKVTYCVSALKDDGGELTIGRFKILNKIGEQIFDDIYHKHINDMSKTEKRQFNKVKKYFQ